jgi:hypothetical protein
MAQKKCKVCEKMKDVKEDFYKSSGLTCRECRNKQTAAKSKETKGFQAVLLLEVRDNQLAMMEHMETMEKEIWKLRKALKQLSTE